MTYNLGNGGTYVGGVTRYAFKPYRGRDVGDTYKEVEISGLGRVWARLEDRGEDVAGRTYGDEVNGVILSRYAVCVPGWGSSTIGSELYIEQEQFEAEEFDRLKKALEA